MNTEPKPTPVEEFSLNELTREQFIVIANETVKKMEWSVGAITDSVLVASTDNGVFSTNYVITIKVIEGQAQFKSTLPTGQPILDTKNKELFDDFVATFNKTKATLTTEQLGTKYEELRSTFQPAESDVFNSAPETTTKKTQDFFSFFKPAEGYIITPILLYLNILIFILMAANGVHIMEPDSESLINWGANFRPKTLDGEWWRIVTSCFLHIGILHLLMNMYALVYIGLLLEPILGSVRFIAAYLLTGITASTASLWWHDFTVSAGASGAIFGMYGVFLALLSTNFIEKNARKSLLTSIGLFVGYNLLYGMKSGIDNAAHIGGLVGGLVIGYAFIPGLKKPEDRKLTYATIGALAVVILIASFSFYKKTPNDIAKYDSAMREFASLEAEALAIYKEAPNTPTEELLKALKEKGIANWNKSIKLIDSFEAMDLPSIFERRNELLREYCELRLGSYELLYRAISENTDEYASRIEEYNKQIEAKINQLGGE